jgi:hypothetical protein
MHSSPAAGMMLFLSFFQSLSFQVGSSGTGTAFQEMLLAIWACVATNIYNAFCFGFCHVWATWHSQQNGRGSLICCRLVLLPRLVQKKKERKKEEDSLFLSANKLVSFDHPQPSLVVVAKLKAQK